MFSRSFHVKSWEVHNFSYQVVLPGMWAPCSWATRQCCATAPSLCPTSLCGRLGIKWIQDVPTSKCRKWRVTLWVPGWVPDVRVIHYLVARMKKNGEQLKESHSQIGWILHLGELGPIWGPGLPPRCGELGRIPCPGEGSMMKRCDQNAMHVLAPVAIGSWYGRLCPLEALWHFKQWRHKNVGPKTII